MFLALLKILILMTNIKKFLFTFNEKYLFKFH